MRHTIHEIAQALGARALGATDILVSGVAEPAMAGPDDLALAMKPEFAQGLGQGRARAALVWDGADWQGMGLEASIVAPRPRYAMAGLSAMMDPGQHFAPGIHPSAVIDPSAEVPEDASIGPLTVIGPNIYQLIDNAGSWSMMAANCYSLDVVIVHGSHVEGKGIPGCLEFTDIRQDLYPGGPLDVGKLGRPIDVVQAAQELGLKVSLSTGYYDQFGVEDSFNPFCGCAEAVPDSAGATAGIRPVEREEG